MRGHTRARRLTHKTDPSGGFRVAKAFLPHLSAFSSGGSGITCQPSTPLILRRNARARRAFSRIKLMINDVLIGVCSATSQGAELTATLAYLRRPGSFLGGQTSAVDANNSDCNCANHQIS